MSTVQEGIYSLFEAFFTKKDLPHIDINVKLLYDYSTEKCDIKGVKVLQNLENILKITLDFLEICQKHTLSGKMDLLLYKQITASKIEFVNFVLESQKIKMNDHQLPIKMHEIYQNHLHVYNGYTI